MTNPLHDFKISSTPHFTAIRGTGPVEHNLETALHRASLSATNSLHPIQGHIKTISKAFDDQVVKRAIRAGGLSAMEQKTVFRKILKNDESVGKSELKKKLVRQVISHFGKTSGEESKAKPVHHVVYAAQPVTSHSAGSASSLANKSSGSIANSGHSVSTMSSTAKHVSSISQLVNTKKTGTAITAAPDKPTISLTE